MEGQRTVNFVRLISAESNESTLSDDSYEYYQTEIYDQLPSVQAARAKQNTKAPHGSLEIEEQQIYGILSSDKTSTQPLKNLPISIQAKRDARNRRNLEIRTIGNWESWKRSQSISRRRVWDNLRGALSSLLPWRHTLHKIEGRFGVGVKAYFVFLRYLIYLNLLYCAFIASFILVPTTVYGQGFSSDLLSFGDNDSALDFILGTGFLERSPVFYGFYTRGSLCLPCLNTPLLYLTGILSILFLSLIMVVRRTMVGYKQTWMLGKSYSMNLSFKILCGWDFTIRDRAGATLKRCFIRNDLKLFLEEKSFSLRQAQRTLTQRAGLYCLRFVLNLLVLFLLGGAFYLIYFATVTSQSMSKMDGHHRLVSLLFEYLPPFTITLVNLFLPHIFRKISTFEDYSFTMQVNATLVRSIFLKLASLGIYLFFLFSTDNPKCWENHFGKEMYKLCIFNFLAMFCSAFLFEYPRKLLQESYPSSCLARLSGKQHFLIPFNVLDLVHNQTVSWVGVYYCPLLPLIGMVTLVATFYIKKFVVLRCCAAEQRMFRASSSSVLFHLMLLLGLLMAVASLGFNLYQLSLSSSCGPFGNGQTVFNVTSVCVNSLPRPAQKTLRYLSSEAFALSLILAEIILLTSCVSRQQANQKAIERLKDMLIMTSSDKRFLVKQHTTILRRATDPHRAHSVSTDED
ncbi:transmembrane channel-like protein 7 [Genypterus blacodes]|uniref:transmembrane channel-like protein 7 n=1 Tax=Genypterus blacodes TaxID=154954 RepID=UPI003F76DD7F